MRPQRSRPSPDPLWQASALGRKQTEAAIISTPVAVRPPPVPAALGLQRRRVPGTLSAANLAVHGEELRISIFVKS